MVGYMEPASGTVLVMLSQVCGPAMTMIKTIRPSSFDLLNNSEKVDWITGIFVHRNSHHTLIHSTFVKTSCEESQSTLRFRM